MTSDADLDRAVIVALGSNLPGATGDPSATLEEALRRLNAAGLMVRRRSRWWRSRAWPDPAKPDYLNGVVLVETALDPAQVLAVLHAIEAGLGRERRTPNADRTLDLDLIAHGRWVVEGQGITLPHPRAADRYFVMGPLAEIAPGWRHPENRQRAETLAASATVGRDAAPISPDAPDLGT